MENNLLYQGIESKRIINVRSMACLILALALLVGFLAFPLLYALQTKLVQPEFYLVAMDRQGFYGEIYEVSADFAAEFITEAGLSVELLDQVITAEWLKAELDMFVAGFLAYLRADSQRLPRINLEWPLNRFQENFQAMLETTIVRPGSWGSRLISGVLNRELEDRLQGLPFTKYWGPRQEAEMETVLATTRQTLASLRTANRIAPFYLLLLLVLLRLAGGRQQWRSWLTLVLFAAGIVALVPSLSILLLLRIKPDNIIGFLTYRLGNQGETILTTFNSLPDIIVSLSQNLLFSFVLYGMVLLLIGTGLILITGSFSRPGRVLPPPGS
jgi:hypothetical protein